MNFGKFIWLKAFKGQNLVCVFATDAEIWCKLSGLQSKKLSCRQVNVETLRSWRARSTLVSALTIWSVKVGCKELKGEKTGYFVPNQPCPTPKPSQVHPHLIATDSSNPLLSSSSHVTKLSHCQGLDSTNLSSTNLSSSTQLQNHFQLTDM